MPHDMERQVTTSDGVTLAYWLTRSPDQPAPTVLMVHGAASNHTRWSELVEKTTLARDWDLLRPDMRGNGRSFYRGRLDLDVWSRDLKEILDAEEIARALLLGHSLGAQIAIRFAFDHLERVQGLVLIDPVVRQALIGKKRLISRTRPLFRLAVWMLQGLNALGVQRRRIPDRDLRELDRETRQALQSGRSADEIARRYSALGPILRCQPTANYLQQLLATTAPLPDLQAIDVPVLVLSSTGITFADSRINSKEIGRLPDVEFAAIEANHWPLTESPDEVRTAIEGWVNRRFPRSGT